MNLSAAALNDTQLTIFPYSVQLPYLQMALSELQELLELNNVPVTNTVPVSIIVPTGILGIGGGNGQPALPAGLIEIQQLFERTSGTNQAYTEMTKCEFLPEYQVTWQSLIYWTWQEQTIKFLGATSDREVKIHCIRAIMPDLTDATNPIDIINSKMFLVYRTAALCAQFIGENPTRATELNNDAAAALDRTLGISTKGRQSIAVRHRPFMASYKSRNGGYHG